MATFGLVAGPSSAPVTEEEKASAIDGKNETEEKGGELGRWDVLVRREAAGKPITVFDVR